MVSDLPKRHVLYTVWAVAITNVHILESLLTLHWTTAKDMLCLEAARI
jgi:hypothetical protein